MISLLCHVKFLFYQRFYNFCIITLLSSYYFVFYIFLVVPSESLDFFSYVTVCKTVRLPFCEDVEVIKGTPGIN